jgi:hypothetical protein
MNSRPWKKIKLSCKSKPSPTSLLQLLRGYLSGGYISFNDVAVTEDGLGGGASASAHRFLSVVIFRLLLGGEPKNCVSEAISNVLFSAQPGDEIRKQIVFDTVIHGIGRPDAVRVESSDESTSRTQVSEAYMSLLFDENFKGYRRLLEWTHSFESDSRNTCKGLYTTAAFMTMLGSIHLFSSAPSSFSQLNFEDWSIPLELRNSLVALQGHASSAPHPPSPSLSNSSSPIDPPLTTVCDLFVMPILHSLSHSIPQVAACAAACFRDAVASSLPVRFEDLATDSLMSFSALCGLFKDCIEPLWNPEGKPVVTLSPPGGCLETLFFLCTVCSAVRGNLPFCVQVDNACDMDIVDDIEHNLIQCVLGIILHGTSDESFLAAALTELTLSLKATPTSAETYDNQAMYAALIPPCDILHTAAYFKSKFTPLVYSHRPNNPLFRAAMLQEFSEALVQVAIEASIFANMRVVEHNTVPHSAVAENEYLANAIKEYSNVLKQCIHVWGCSSLEEGFDRRLQDALSVKSSPGAARSLLTLPETMGSLSGVNLIAAANSVESVLSSQTQIGQISDRAERHSSLQVVVEPIELQLALTPALSAPEPAVVAATSDPTQAPEVNTQPI